jgi:hypothetical protein
MAVTRMTLTQIIVNPPRVDEAALAVAPDAGIAP